MTTSSLLRRRLATCSSSEREQIDQWLSKAENAEERKLRRIKKVLCHNGFLLSDPETHCRAELIAGVR
jgi:hypothetical protein